MDEMEEDHMILRRLLAVILLLCTVSIVHASAGDLCYDDADPALSSLKTWKDLRLWYENYPECDDGYFAEGLSEFVVVTLAKRWETLSSLQTEIMKNNKFTQFVLQHIDETTDENDLRMVVSNAETKCPSNLRPLCKEIEKHAQMSLKELKVVEFSDVYKPTDDFLKFIDDLNKAVESKDDKFIYSKVSNKFYYTRDFGGMFNQKISAVDNFSNVFVFDDKRLRKEYTGTGWKKFSELINSKIFQYINGDICGPAEAQPEGGIFPSGDIFDYCYINGTNVNLRDSPSLGSNILMQMSFELVKLLEYKSDWIKIETLNGIEAYVYRKYVGFYLSDKICFRTIEDEWKIVGYIGGGD